MARVTLPTRETATQVTLPQRAGQLNLNQLQDADFEQSKTPVLGKESKAAQAIRGFEKRIRPIGEFFEQAFGGALTTVGLSEEAAQRRFGITPEPTTGLGRAGEFAGVGAGIAAQIVPVARGVQLAGRGLQAARALPAIGRPLAALGRGVAAGGITTAAAEGAAFGAIGTEGGLRERAGGAAIGAPLGGIVGGLLRGAGAVSRAITKSLPDRLVVRSLNLTKPQRASIKKITGKTPQQFIKEKGIIGNADQVETQLRQIATQSRARLDTGLSELATKFAAKNKNAAQILKLLDTEFKGIPGVESEQAVIKSLISENTKTGLTLPRLNQVKRLVDQNLSIFARSGEVKAGIKAQGLRNLRSTLQSFIETKADDLGFSGIKAINKETQTATEIANAIFKSNTDDISRNIIGLTDLLLLGGGGAAGAISGEGNIPLTAIGIVLSRKALQNPAFATRLAAGLRKLAPEQVTLIQRILRGARGEVLEEADKKALKEIVDEAQKRL